MKKNEIKFCGDYQKVWGQTKAKLLQVDIDTKKSLNLEFVEYDTLYFDKNNYQFNYNIPNGLLLILTFIGDKRIPFTTVRRATGKKKERFEKLIGQWFDIIVDGNEENKQLSVFSQEKSND